MMGKLLKGELLLLKGELLQILPLLAVCFLYWLITGVQGFSASFPVAAADRAASAALGAGMILLPLVYSIQLFRQMGELFGKRGTLLFTLPVAPWQIVLAKLLFAFLMGTACIFFLWLLMRGEGVLSGRIFEGGMGISSLPRKLETERFSFGRQFKGFFPLLLLLPAQALFSASLAHLLWKRKGRALLTAFFFLLLISVMSRILLIPESLMGKSFAGGLYWEDLFFLYFQWKRIWVLFWGGYVGGTVYLVSKRMNL